MERENKAMKRLDHLTTAPPRVGAQSSVSGMVVGLVYQTHQERADNHCKSRQTGSPGKEVGAQLN